MSLPPMPEPPDEIDDRYRRASALDPSRPGEAVRRRVLEHAAQLAAERSGGRAAGPGSPASAGRRRRSWRPIAVFGTLAAAAVAGLMIAPRFLLPPVAQSSRVASIPVEKPRAPSASSAPNLSQFTAPTAPPPAPALEMAPSRQQELSAPPPSAMVAPSAPSRPAVSAERSASVAKPEQRTADLAADQALAGRAVAAAPAAPPANAASGSVNEQQMAVTSARRAALAPPAAKVADATAAFRHAAETGDLRSLDRLLATQPDIDARDAAGRTPLMLAVQNGQTDVVSALLAYGADPNAADSHGTTPLQAARSGGRPAIISALQRYGAR